jgi:XTP/dITP diphosphohydrolase
VIISIALITGNQGKAREFADLLGLDVTAVKEELTEVQALDVADVVTRKAEEAYAKIGAPVLVDDTGLTLHAWNGLPGALIKWFLDTVGTGGILQMAAGVGDRAATVTTALGYADAAGVRVYTGTVHGQLATVERGHSGFGYDCIFIPDGSSQTFAEMTPQQKNAISHRRRAVDALREGLGINQEQATP